MEIRHARIVALVVLVAALAGTAAGDETLRVSNALSGSAGSKLSWLPTVSADGNVIAFVSYADDLVPGDSNDAQDVFVYDRTTSTLERVSVDSSGTEADEFSDSVSLSADGRYVAFSSYATNLDNDPNGGIGDVFLHDRLLKTTRLISLDPNGIGADADSGSPAISDDGSRIAFQSWATNLTSDLDVDGAADIFEWDAASGSIALVSVRSDGTPIDADCKAPQLSGNGDVVAYAAMLGSRSGTSTELFVHDGASGSIEQIGGTWQGPAWLTGINGDGTLLLFEPLADLVPEDTNQGGPDVYLFDRTDDSFTCVALALDGLSPQWGSTNGRLSGDGRFVAFESWDSRIVPVDDNDTQDLFLLDRVTGVTTRLSIGTFDEQASRPSWMGNGHCLSGDGSVAAYWSPSTEFASGDANAIDDVFVRVRSMVTPTWSNYGSGYPGRGGTIPTLTAAGLPYRGTKIGIDVGNSSGLYSVGFVFTGIARDSLATRLGGTLLVDPLLVFALPLDPYTNSFAGAIPTDWWADGLTVDLQVLELDPFATRGVSFTPGLELLFGDR